MKYYLQGILCGQDKLGQFGWCMEYTQDSGRDILLFLLFTYFFPLDGNSVRVSSCGVERILSAASTPWQLTSSYFTNDCAILNLTWINDPIKGKDSMI